MTPRPDPPAREFGHSLAAEHAALARRANHLSNRMLRPVQPREEQHAHAGRVEAEGQADGLDGKWSNRDGTTNQDAATAHLVRATPKHRRDGQSGVFLRYWIQQSLVVHFQRADGLDG